MNLRGTMKIIAKKLYSRLGFQILNPRKGKVKFRTLEGEFTTFMTSGCFGFFPVENPESIHWTIHTKRKIPKENALIYLLLPFFEGPAEFHEKVRGKVTKKFKQRDMYSPFRRFVEERRKERDP